MGGKSLKVLREGHFATVVSEIFHPTYVVFNNKPHFLHVQFIYMLYNPEGSMKLYQFIIICGVITLILAQLPSFHSLRHINMISLILSVTYATCVTVGSIYIGKKRKNTQIALAA